MQNEPEASWPPLPWSVEYSLQQRLGDGYDDWHESVLLPARRWATELGIQATGTFCRGSSAAIFEGTHPIWGSVVLKINVDTGRWLQEVRSWDIWTDHQLPELWSSNEAGMALVCQRLTPGTPLDETNLDRSILQSAVELAERLHRSPNAQALNGRTEVDLINDRNARAAILAQQLDHDIGEWLDLAGAMSISLRQSTENIVVLHGDFYPDNILQAGVSLMAIDAEPCIGDPVFDLATLAYGVTRGNEIDSFAKELAASSGCDANRILDWAAVIAASNLSFRINSRRADAMEIETTMDLVRRLGIG